MVDEGRRPTPLVIFCLRHLLPQSDEDSVT
jgi:hypothetical protein